MVPVTLKSPLTTKVEPLKVKFDSALSVDPLTLVITRSLPALVIVAVPDGPGGPGTP